MKSINRELDGFFWEGLRMRIMNQFKNHIDNELMYKIYYKLSGIPGDTAHGNIYYHCVMSTSPY